MRQLPIAMKYTETTGLNDVEDADEGPSRSQHKHERAISLSRKSHLADTAKMIPSEPSRYVTEAAESKSSGWTRA